MTRTKVGDVQDGPRARTSPAACPKRIRFFPFFLLLAPSTFLTMRRRLETKGCPEHKVPDRVTE
jgi:hypothetical protein